MLNVMCFSSKLYLQSLTRCWIFRSVMVWSLRTRSRVPPFWLNCETECWFWAGAGAGSKLVQLAMIISTSILFHCRDASFSHCAPPQFPSNLRNLTNMITLTLYKCCSWPACLQWYPDMTGSWTTVASLSENSENLVGYLSWVRQNTLHWFRLISHKQFQFVLMVTELPAPNVSDTLFWTSKCWCYFGTIFLLAGSRFFGSQNAKN